MRKSEKPSEGGAVPRKKTRKPFVVGGVIVAVLVAAGVGFSVWREQPSFCNAICHDPMDNYVEGYYENESIGAYAHQAEGVTCLQCHEATIDAQVHEGLAWISQDFETDENGVITKQLVTADKKMCVTSGCHNWDDVVSATENWGGEAGVNPHKSHQGEALDCSYCHGIHTDSVMYCNACHDYKIPDGWKAPAKTDGVSHTA